MSSKTSLLFFQFRKDFDAERVKDAEKFGNSRSQTGASNKNSSEAEAK